MRSHGPLPLSECLNLGTACPALNVSDPPFIQPGPYPLDSSDTRVLSSFFQDGVLWTTLGTGLKGLGGSSYDFSNNLEQVKLQTKAGVAYFALQPYVVERDARGRRRATGIPLDPAREPDLPVARYGSDGIGYIGATRVGPRHFASPAYIRIGLGIEPTVVEVVLQGGGSTKGSRERGRAISARVGVTTGTRPRTMTDPCGSRPSTPNSAAP